MDRATINSTPKSILFVCLGNICRSPAAEGLFVHFASEYIPNLKITVDSAGTYGGHAGSKADSRMRKAASKRGYNLTSLSRQVKYDDFYLFDIIFAMDDSNYHNLLRLAPEKELQQKVVRFADFVTSIDIDHVPDPYYEGADGFEFVLDILEDGCKNICSQIDKIDQR